MVERVATMPDPAITQPNYAIDPIDTALDVAVGAENLINLREV